MKNEKTFKEFMSGIGELFDKKISDTLKNMYWQALKPFTDIQCSQAFNIAITRCKFFPKPADLIEFIIGNSKQVEQNKDDKALVIVNNIISHLKTCGARVFPEIKDPIAKHLMTKRWPYHLWAATVVESELKWWSKEFCDAYKTYTESGDVPFEITANENIKKLAGSVSKQIGD